MLGAGALVVGGCTSGTSTPATSSFPVTSVSGPSGSSIAASVAGSAADATGTGPAAAGGTGSLLPTDTAPTTGPNTATGPAATAGGSAESGVIATTATAPSTTMKPGNITETVPTVPGTTRPPIPLTSTATFGGSVTAAVTKVMKADLTATGPGEFSGPGIELTLSIGNGSADSIDLSVVNVTVVGANGVAAIPVQNTPAAPFSGQLASGAKASAVYVFSLHSKPSNPVTVAAGYSAAAPVVAFSGNL